MNVLISALYQKNERLRTNKKSHDANTVHGTRYSLQFRDKSKVDWVIIAVFKTRSLLPTLWKELIKIEKKITENVETKAVNLLFTYITWQCANSYIQYFVEMYIYKLVFSLFIWIVIKRIANLHSNI